MISKETRDIMSEVPAIDDDIKVQGFVNDSSDNSTDNCNAILAESTNIVDPPNAVEHDNKQSCRSYKHKSSEPSTSSQKKALPSSVISKSQSGKRDKPFSTRKRSHNFPKNTTISPLSIEYNSKSDESSNRSLDLEKISKPAPAKNQSNKKACTKKVISKNKTTHHQIRSPSSTDYMSESDENIILCQQLGKSTTSKSSKNKSNDIASANNVSSKSKTSHQSSHSGNQSLREAVKKIEKHDTEKTHIDQRGKIQLLILKKISSTLASKTKTSRILFFLSIDNIKMK